jgi:hypothetical protein
MRFKHLANPAEEIIIRFSFPVIFNNLILEPEGKVIYLAVFRTSFSY